MKTVYEKNGNTVNLLQDSDLEYGNNENGQYIKYSNGVLIQWGNVNKTITGWIKSNGEIYYSDNYGITLPIDFINDRYSAYVVKNSTSKLCWIYSTSAFSKNYFEFNLLANANNADYESDFDWFAIGRWI